MKMFGRGALLLAAGAFNLSMWVFWALFALLGFVVSIKATTERITWSWLQRSKARRARRDLAVRQDAVLQDISRKDALLRDMALRHPAPAHSLAPVLVHG
jgi:hypothetical protein